MPRLACARIFDTSPELQRLLKDVFDDAVRQMVATHGGIPAYFWRDHYKPFVRRAFIDRCRTLGKAYVDQFIDELNDPKKYKKYVAGWRRFNTSYVVKQFN